jgi:hypothetical protein
LEPTPHVVKLADALRADIEARANGGEGYGEWEVEGYRGQVVGGLRPGE